jgi:hypothetical protein
VKRVLRTAVIAAVATMAAGLAAGPAHASTTVVVAPGQSIQAAVAAAKPGDTIQLLPGTYHESVTVSTDNVTLRGAGAGPNGTVLLPPAVFPDNPCGRVPPNEGPPSGGGICVYGIFDDHFVVSHYVTGVRVTGIRVSGFAVDVATLYAENSQIDHVAAFDGGHYGIISIISRHLMIDDNVVRGAGHAGMYVGNYGVADSATTVTRNDVSDSFYGVSVRNSQGVTFTQNSLHDNCSGYLGWDDTHPSVPAGGDKVVVASNVVVNNNQSCAGGDPAGFPVVHGTGIVLIGNGNTRVEQNVVTGNVGTEPLSGGIVVSQQTWIPPAVIESNDTITGNMVYGNGPADLRWDQQGSGVAFTSNHCLTSSPGGLCG